MGYADLTDEQWDELVRKYRFDFMEASDHRRKFDTNSTTGAVLFAKGSEDAVRHLSELFGGIPDIIHGTSQWQWHMYESLESNFGAIATHLVSSMDRMMWKLRRYGIFDRNPMRGRDRWVQFMKELNSGPHPVS